MKFLNFKVGISKFSTVPDMIYGVMQLLTSWLSSELFLMP